MVDLMKIEKGVEENLNDVGLAKEGETWLVYKVLFHLFVTDEIVRKMTKYQLDNAKYWYGRVFKAVFVRKLLRETKRTKKYRLPPAPPTMVKETKERTETYLPIKNGTSLSLEEKKKAFHEECHQFDEQYGAAMVDEFYVHWSEENMEEGKMLWEYQRTWNTAKRLYKWSRNAITDARKLADLRLEQAKVHNRDGSAVHSNTTQQDAVAMQRAADNARREEELAKARAEHVSYAEYQRLQQEKESAEALPQQEASQTPSLDNPKTVL